MKILTSQFVQHNCTGFGASGSGATSSVAKSRTTAQKGLAVLMAIAMVVGTLPLYAFASASAQGTVASEMADTTEGAETALAEAQGADNAPAEATEAPAADSAALSADDSSPAMNSAAPATEDAATSAPEAISPVQEIVLESPLAEGDIPIDEAHFPDANFRAFLIAADFNVNHDAILTADERAMLSLPEAERNQIDCRYRVGSVVHSLDIKSLQGIEYFPNLRVLICDFNPLDNLDLSKNTAITILHCSSCSLQDIDLSMLQNLTALEINDNQLTELDVSHNEKMTHLYCLDNQLSALDISSNPNLQVLQCARNQLDALDLSANTQLSAVYCSDNHISSLDVSHLTGLLTLWCSNNVIPQLDLSNSPVFWSLQCENNCLTSLDLSATTSLRNVSDALPAFTQYDNAYNTQKSGPILRLAQPDGSYMVDLNQIVSTLGDTSFDISKLTLTDGGTLDTATGLITYTARPDAVTYTYNTSNTNAKFSTMADVTVTLIDPVITYNMNGAPLDASNTASLAWPCNASSSDPADAGRYAMNCYTSKEAFQLAGGTGTAAVCNYADHTFLGWNTAANGSGTMYQPGDELAAAQNITLYAQWEKNIVVVPTPAVPTPEPIAPTPAPAGTFQVTFDDSHGTPDVVTIAAGSTAAPLETGRESYNFLGWYLNGAPFDFSTPITQNITLTAKWEHVGSGSASSTATAAATSAPAASPAALPENSANTTAPAASNAAASTSNTAASAPNAAASTSAEAASPKTGDSTHTALWASLMGFSLLGLAGLGISRKKKRKTKR